MTSAPGHHRPGGFQNNDTECEPKGLATVLRRQLDSRRSGLPPPAQTATPVVAADTSFIRANALAGAAMHPAITWVGHATTRAQVGGISVITDPVFSQRGRPHGDEALDLPPQHLAGARRARGLADDAFTVMAIGETSTLPRRPR